MTQARRQERRAQRRARRQVRRADRREDRADRREARADRVRARGGGISRANRIDARADRAGGRAETNRSRAAEIIGGDATTLRLEARLLSVDDWARFIAAIRTLKETPGYWDDLVEEHQGAMGFAHHNVAGAIYREGFLTWHRQYLLDFEEDLRDVDPSIRLPYWDWRSRRRVPVHMEQQDWMNLTGERGRRAAAFGRKIQLNRIERIRDFSQMSETIQDLHDSIHGSLGSDMRTPMNSPNDPIFFMHHAFVDKMWDYWQAQNPDIALVHPFPDDVLPGYTETNADVMDNAALGVEYF